MGSLGMGRKSRPRVVWAVSVVWQGGSQAQFFHSHASEPQIFTFLIFISLGSMHLDILKLEPSQVFSYLRKNDESFKIF